MKAIELLEQALPYVRGQNEALVRKIEKKLRKDGKQRELTVAQSFYEIVVTVLCRVAEVRKRHWIEPDHELCEWLGCSDYTTFQMEIEKAFWIEALTAPEVADKTVEQYVAELLEQSRSKNETL